MPRLSQEPICIKSLNLYVVLDVQPSNEYSAVSPSMEPHVDDERQPLLQTAIQDLDRLSSDEDGNQSSGLHDLSNRSDLKEPSNSQLAVILGSIWVRSKTCDRDCISTVWH